jgi:hypothetical protein
MKFIFLLFFTGFVLISFNGQAQINADNETFLYDPLFWKKELKLTEDQGKQIKAINADFYSSIIDAYNRQLFKQQKSIGSELLLSRNEKLWNTFSDRQKKKWKKLVYEYEGHSSESYHSRSGSNLGAFKLLF